LQNNSTLLELNLKFNKGMKNVKEERVRRSWYSNTRTIIPRQDGGRFAVVRGALFDTKSFDSIAGSNHVCAVEMSGKNQGDSFEETISKVIYDLFAFIVYIVIHRCDSSSSIHPLHPLTTDQCSRCNRRQEDSLQSRVGAQPREH
jgi:hypothetical protein